MTYDVDRHCWPIELDGGGADDGIAFELSGTTYTGSLGADTYYAHADTSQTTYPGLLDAVLDVLNTQGSFSITASTPSGSGLDNSGITITEDNGSSWRWLFGNASFTLDRRYLGYHPDSSSPSAATSIASPYSIWGCWQSHLWWAVHGARDKRIDEVYDIDRSTDRLARSYQLEYGNGVTKRTFEYRDVAAAHVYPRRAEDATHADNADLPAPSSGKGDINNQLYDLHQRAAGGGEILVIHDRGDASDVVTNVDQWEVYQTMAETFSEWTGDPTEEKAEQYDPDWEVQIVDEPTTGGRKDYVTTP